MTSPLTAAYYVSVSRKGVIHECVAGIPVASGVDAADVADVADAADASAFGNALWASTVNRWALFLRLHNKIVYRVLCICHKHFNCFDICPFSFFHNNAP